MKTITKYESNDGTIWDNEREALLMDEQLTWEDGISPQVKKLRDIVFDLLDIRNYTVLDLPVIIIPNNSKLKNYKIDFNFDCSNSDYTKNIGQLLVILSNLNNSYVRFPLNDSIELIVARHPEHIEADIKYLTSALKNLQI